MTATAADHPSTTRHVLAWLCAAVALAFIAGVALWLDVSLWSIVVMAIALACPVVALWIYALGRRPLPVPLGPVPQTRGVSLDWLAPWYDVVCRAVGVNKRFRDLTLQLAALRPGEHVLDVGCGTGVLARRAADMVGVTGSCCGIDVAPDMVRMAQQSKQAGVNPVRFSLGVVEELAFEASSFDVVFLSFVLHCLPPDLKEAGLREIRRVLRPGGRLVVVDLDQPVGLLPRFLARLCLRHPYMAMHLEGRTIDLLRAAGFSAVARRSSWRGLVGFWIAAKPA
ncbi:methyltransferase domain-containing protein [Vineibacter terrae]|uniref:Methyltransferase domain-containing protein n=1 Tax=Vineibacter terrae TaxID=2586908 RepID=A0A5C8PIF8_9HYPH|nr:methyltransferase domain-containing protein [Vineibacter terrae]TXL73129.1 methyltransferase domain-containing protein [Vineibacter terrae]